MGGNSCICSLKNVPPAGMQSAIVFLENGVTKAEDARGNTIASGTNSASVINSAINFVNALGGGIVFVDVGEYDITEAIVRKTGVTVKGAGKAATILNIPSTAADSTQLMTYTGANGTGRDIADAAANDVTVTTDTASHAGDFAAGDIILIVDATNIDGDNATRTEGETHIVLSAVAGTGVITLDTPLEHAYVTVGADSPKVFKITPIADADLEDLTVQSEQSTSSIDDGSGQIVLKFCKNTWFRNVRFKNLWIAELQFYTCYNFGVDADCEFLEPKAAATSRYCISTRGACRSGDIDGYFWNSRHGYTSGAGSTGASLYASPQNAGRPTDITVKGRHYATSEALIDLHRGCGYHLFKPSILCGNLGTDLAAVSAAISLRSPADIDFGIAELTTQGIHLHADSAVDGGASGTKIKGGRFRRILNDSATDAIIRSDADVLDVEIAHITVEPNCECKFIDTASSGQNGWWIHDCDVDALGQTVSAETIEISGNDWVVEGNRLRNNDTAAGKPATINAGVTGLLWRDNHCTGNTSNNVLDSSGSTTNVVIGGGVELSNTPLAGANDTVLGTANRYIHTFTMPTAAKFYRAVAFEWLNGTVVAGNVGGGIMQSTADPPTLNPENILAFIPTTAQSGASAVQRAARISSGLIAGGSIVSCYLTVSDATARLGTTTVGSSNVNKAITINNDVPNSNATALAAGTEEPYVKIYFEAVIA